LNAIDALFRRLRSQGRKAFMPFLTAGDPDLAATKTVLQELPACGADLVEIGFPYSDPIADGPVIQASYTRALGRGIRLEQILQTIADISAMPSFAEGRIPLVGMFSYSLVQRRGLEGFLAQACAARLSGAIVPDLPVDEAGELGELAAARDFKLIQLVTPTTPRERAVRIARASTGFLYCVSITGITGERDQLPETLVTQIRWLRTQTDLPICVGFGISKPEHVRMLREVADGVIVGSALVRCLEQAGKRSMTDIAADIGALTRNLARALNPDGESGR
jgi:tryptophan synthase alpha chain